MLARVVSTPTGIELGALVASGISEPRSSRDVCGKTLLTVGGGEHVVHARRVGRAHNLL
jgi:hypothetical protein